MAERDVYDHLAAAAIPDGVAVRAHAAAVEALVERLEAEVTPFRAGGRDVAPVDGVAAAVVAGMPAAIGRALGIVLAELFAAPSSLSSRDGDRALQRRLVELLGGIFDAGVSAGVDSVASGAEIVRPDEARRQGAKALIAMVREHPESLSSVERLPATIAGALDQAADELEKLASPSPEGVARCPDDEERLLTQRTGLRSLAEEVRAVSSGEQGTEADDAVCLWRIDDQHPWVEWQSGDESPNDFPDAEMATFVRERASSGEQEARELWAARALDGPTDGWTVVPASAADAGRDWWEVKRFREVLSESAPAEEAR